MISGKLNAILILIWQHEEDHFFPKIPQNKTQPPARFIPAMAILSSFPTFQRTHRHSCRKQQRTNARGADCG